MRKRKKGDKVKTMNIEDIEKHIVDKKKISRGTTKDQKYLLVLDDGSTLFERFGPISRYEAFQNMYDALVDLQSLNEPGIPKPFFLNREDDTAYLITSYSKGTPLLDTLSKSSKEETQAFGENAGKLLQALHTLSPEIPSDIGDYDQAFKKILSNYVSLSLYLPGEQNIIRFILNNMKEVMTARKQTYIHGNFSLNILWNNDKGDVFFVDICDISSFDPFYDFHKTGVLTRYQNPLFAKSLISSYTNNDPQNDFWLAFDVYNAIELLKMTVIDVQNGERKKAIDHFKEVNDDFNNFSEANLVPKFYKEN